MGKKIYSERQYFLDIYLYDNSGPYLFFDRLHDSESKNIRGINRILKIQQAQRA